jgi:tripartite-type tricarboxylate transporter receptor subunit TctC
VPYPAGGGLEAITRRVCERLSVRTGRAFLIDHRVGASGMVGAAFVARAVPDGNTILATVADTQINNAAVFQRLPYDPVRDFAPITQLAHGAAVMVVPAAVPAKTLAEFIAHVRSKNERLFYGSWSIGGLGHLMTEAFNRVEKLGMVHSPRCGDGELMKLLLEGGVVLAMSSLAGLGPYLQRGVLRPLAVSGARRLAALPNVPTFAEQGYGDTVFGLSVWMGLLAPSGTPVERIDALRREVRAVLDEPDVQRELEALGCEPIGDTPAEFANALDRYRPVLEGLIRCFGLEPR